MSFPASSVYDMSRSLLNDQIGAIYTDAVQEPYLNIALRDLGTLLERSNVPVTNSTSASISLLPGVDILTMAQLPAGLVEIQELLQRDFGSQDRYFPIQKYEFLPHWDEMRTSNIPAWAWMEQTVRFIPSNAHLEVRIDFIKSVLPPVTSPATTIDLINSLNFLGYRTASLCAKYIGENQTRSDSLNLEAAMEWDKMEGISTKGRQVLQVRRQPFKSRNYPGSFVSW